MGGPPHSSLGKPKEEIGDDRNEQCNTQDGGPNSVVIWAATAAANGSSPPVVGVQCIYHHSHGHCREHSRAYPAYIVTEVEQTHGETTQDDCEVEP